MPVSRIPVGPWVAEQSVCRRRHSITRCFNNIGKHSAATNVNISLATADGRLRLIVEDNGVGFNVQEALAKRESFGLSGMRERVALLGGEFYVESRMEGTKKGTKISIELPIAK
jgi:signal transduction histidine kinase